MTQWSRVIFTDESSFAVRPMRRNMRVWRRPGERYDATCMVPTHKSGYELVNVWGRFSYYGKVPLVRIEGSFTNTRYMLICDQVLWPWVVRVYGSLNNVVLQEDNCGPHRAIAVRNYMTALGVSRMVWPPQSPDLNPIENAWGHLKKHFRNQTRHPKNKDECWIKLQSEWNSLPMSYFHELVGSMASRITEVLARNGGCTKY